MNHAESQIANFESCNAGIPESLAVSALVERFFEGWDASDIDSLSISFDPTETEDWNDLANSPAWAHTDKDSVRAGIQSKILGWKIESLEDELQTLDSCAESDIARINEIKQEIAQLCADSATGEI